MTTINTIQFPYISIFDPNTLAAKVPETPDIISNVVTSPDRSRISPEALVRLRAFDAVNNQLVTYLRPIDETEDALADIRSEIADLKTLADNAVTLKTTPDATPGTGPVLPVARLIEARTTAIIDENTLVDGASAGMRLSISSDNGEDFLFTFGNNTTTWGEVVEQLNVAEIGLQARFDRSSADGARLVIESTNGRTGFRINGTSSRQVVDDLVGITSPYDGGYNAAKFTDGAGAGTSLGGRGPQGLIFGNGGSLVSAGQDGVIAAGSTLRFSGSDGLPHKWTAQGATSLRSLMLDINAMRGSVVADITGEGRLRLRDTQGGDVTIGAATGSFAQSGTMRLERDVAPPPQAGLPADAIAARPSAQIDRETLVSGATNGMRLSISSDSGQNFTYTFGMDADKITWGQVADALNASEIGVGISFEENQIGSSRLTLHAQDGRTGFRIDGASSRQVVDDLFGISSPYDGAFQAQMFADGAAWPAVGVDAVEHGMTFGRGGAVKSIAAAGPLSSGSSITFIDADGLPRSWMASGSNTSPITLIEDFRAMRTNIIAEFASDGSLRLRNVEGRAIQIVEATGDFDVMEGPLRFEASVAAPEVARPRTNEELAASVGRLLSARLMSVAEKMNLLAYTKNIATSEILASSAMLASAAPQWDWVTSTTSVTATRDTIGTVLGNVEATLAQLTDRLSTLHTMEGSYRELGSDLKNFAVEMLDSYLTWDEARAKAELIQAKLSQTTGSMSSEQARDLLLLLG